MPYFNIGIGDYFIGYFLIINLLFVISPLLTFTWITFVILSIGISYAYYDKTYWKRLGIPSTVPNLFFGDTLRQMSEGLDFVKQRFDETNGNTFGSYFLGRKCLTTMNTSLIEAVLNNEMNHFNTRYQAQMINESQSSEISIYRNILSFTEGHKAINMRKVLTPMLFRAKIKEMIPRFNESTRILNEFISKHFVEKGKDVPILKIFRHLVCDQNGRAFFSTDFKAFDSFFNNASPIIKHSMLLFRVRFAWFRALVIAFCSFTIYVFEQMLGFDVWKSPTTDFFYKYFKKLLQQRIEKVSTEKDLFQDLMKPVEEGRITKIELYAQSFAFFGQGRSETLQFATFLLACHPEIQENLREEINSIMEGQDEVRAEHVDKMVYLKKVIMETLRLCPPNISMNRVCTANITLNLTQGDSIKEIPFQRGDIVIFPIYHIHRNPEFYPNPEIFDPERFSGNFNDHNNFTFLPFGKGRRQCIAKNLSEYQVCVSLVMLVKKFRFSKADNSPVQPLKLFPGDSLLPEQELYVKVEEVTTQ